MRLAFLTSLCFVASPVFAEMQVSTAIYQCERGVEIAESVVSTEEDAVAVIHVEGRQITLVRTPAASGVRYAWPSDGSGYVWWTKGNEATLGWFDAEKSEDVTLYEACRAN